MLNGAMAGRPIGQRDAVDRFGARARKMQRAAEVSPHGLSCRPRAAWNPRSGLPLCWPPRLAVKDGEKVSVE